MPFPALDDINYKKSEFFYSQISLLRQAGITAV
jgi:hypothetical protein